MINKHKKLFIILGGDLCYREKESRATGLRVLGGGGVGCKIINKEVRADLLKKVTFGQKLKEAEGLTLCKGPEAGVCPVCSANREEAVKLESRAG